MAVDASFLFFANTSVILWRRESFFVYFIWLWRLVTSMSTTKGNGNGNWNPTRIYLRLSIAKLSDSRSLCCLVKGHGLAKDEQTVVLRDDCFPQVFTLCRPSLLFKLLTKQWICNLHALVGRQAGKERERKTKTGIPRGWCNEKNERSRKMFKHVPCVSQDGDFRLFLVNSRRKERKVKVCNKLILPFKEVCVFGLPDKTGPHHDRLEALSLDRPELAIRYGCYCCGSLTVVQYGELAEHLGPRQGWQIFPLARYFDSAFCESDKSWMSSVRLHAQSRNIQMMIENLGTTTWKLLSMREKKVN